MSVPKLRLRLFHKLLLFGNTGVILAGFSVGLIFQSRARELLRAELLARGDVLAESLAANATKGVETQNAFRSLEPLIASTVERRDVAYARIFDRTGKLLAGAEARASAGSRLEVAKDILSRSELLSDDPGSEAGSRRRRPIGTVRLGLSVRNTEAQIRKTVLFSWLMVGAILAFGIAVMWLFGHRLCAPVAEMAQAAARIGVGETGVLVPDLSQDELGDLARAFNRMSRDLSCTTVSNEYLDSILRHMADILIVANIKGEIRKVNPAALELLGYCEIELLGRSAEIVYGRPLLNHGAGPPLALHETLFQEGLIKDLELNLLARSGEKIPVLLSGATLKDRRGEVTGMVFVAKNLSERKAMEARMRQSEKLSALGRLAGGVAHEINNPLSVILGFAQDLAREIPAGDPLDLPLRSIEREAIRCRNLVRDLLVFVRQTSVRLEEFDVNEAVENALRLVETQARLQAVEVNRAIEDPGKIRGDKTKLQQVIINLCTNAIDAMPQGGTLWVRARREHAEQRARVLLEVEDNGTGIPPSLQPHIFEPFFSTKETGKGTGLGLAIVHEIVTRQGGTIDLKS
ncbi:MAG: PAS domain S-box protein, partial [Candidatus Terrybacteria bacterium]|nr:PAS domain S-box protein [Candidatus Terrybacteria bacterium]